MSLFIQNRQTMLAYLAAGALTLGAFIFSSSDQKKAASALFSDMSEAVTQRYENARDAFHECHAEARRRIPAAYRQ